MANSELEDRLLRAATVVDPLNEPDVLALVGRRRRNRRRRRSAAGLAAVAAVAVGIVTLVPAGHSTVQVTTSPSTGRRDTRTTTSTVPAPIPTSTVPARTTTTVPAQPPSFLTYSDFRPVAPIAPTGFTVGDGAIYVTGSISTRTADGSAGVSAVDRVDPTTGKVTASARFDNTEQLTTPVVADGAIWVAGASIDELDPVTLRTVAKIPAPADVTGLAAAGARLWAVSATRLYETTFAQRALTAVRGIPPVAGVAANRTGSILAVSLPDLDIDRLDPVTGHIIDRYAHTIHANNLRVVGIAGQVAWDVGGVGMNNALDGVNLATGRIVNLNDFTAPFRGVLNGGEGSSFVWSGHTLLATQLDGPEWCVDPSTGRTEKVFTTPSRQPILAAGVADGWLYAGTGNSYSLARTRLPGCG